VKNLFTGEQLGTMYSTDWLNATVCRTEVFLVKAELITIGESE